MFGSSSSGGRGTLTVDRITEDLEADHRKRAAEAKRVGCPTFTRRGPNGESGLWVCAHDPGEMTEHEAHLAMQVHRACDHWACAVRRRGHKTLVDSSATAPGTLRYPR